MDPRSGKTADNPKNRRMPYPLYVLPPVRCYTGTSGGALQPWLGVEQPNISKYLDPAADIPGQVVASPKFLTGLLAAAKSVGAMTDLVPHLWMPADGTYIPYKKEKNQPTTTLVHNLSLYW